MCNRFSRYEFNRYELGGIATLESMNRAGSEALLSAAQPGELDGRLHQQPRASAASVARWVKERFGVPTPGTP